MAASIYRLSMDYPANLAALTSRASRFSSSKQEVRVRGDHGEDLRVGAADLGPRSVRPRQALDARA